MRQPYGAFEHERDTAAHYPKTIPAKPTSEFVKEIIDPRTGYLLRPEDEDAILEAK